MKNLDQVGKILALVVLGSALHYFGSDDYEVDSQTSAIVTEKFGDELESLHVTDIELKTSMTLSYKSKSKHDGDRPPSLRKTNNVVRFSLDNDHAYGDLPESYSVPESALDLSDGPLWFNEPVKVKKTYSSMIFAKIECEYNKCTVKVNEVAKPIINKNDFENAVDVFVSTLVNKLSEEKAKYKSSIDMASTNLNSWNGTTSTSSKAQ